MHAAREKTLDAEPPAHRPWQMRRQHNRTAILRNITNVYHVPVPVQIAKPIAKDFLAFTFKAL